MAYTINEQNEVIISGWENGIAISPHKGVANLKNVNISTENGEVMVSYARVQESQTNTDTQGNLSYVDTSHLSASIPSTTVTKGIWISVTNSSDTGVLPNADYWISLSTGSGIQLASTYNGSVITGYPANFTAKFTIKTNFGKPIATATETYYSGTTTQYRYYIIDSAGLLWVYDTLLANSDDGIYWFCPTTSLDAAGATGLAVLNGWVLAFAGNTIWCKSTVQLGGTPGWVSFASGVMQSTATTPNTHYAYVGHQGRLYYTDGVYLGSIFPNTSLVSGFNNIQSYARYTATTTTGTIAQLYAGSLPYTGTSGQRIPAVFFSTGTKPTAITVGTIYYIEYIASTAKFEVYAAASGGAAIDIETGSSGDQFFNTFYPTSSGGKATITFTPQRVVFPFFEKTQAITEIGNNVVIGGTSNTLYLWDQVGVTPNDIIPLPEANVVNLLTVNNMAYVFAGYKGNIYVTNGSTASLVLTVPDYCAGIPGYAGTYVEPYFTWGDAIYLRGRVYFSVLDETKASSVGVIPTQQTKAGNCGGIWSFIPTQNFFVGQEFGLALRLENQNSYATYNGYCPVLIGAENQTGKGAQYWSAWQSALTNAKYGIDYTSTQTLTSGIVETDLIPTGTFLNKKTFSQIEYKLATNIDNGASVGIKYRVNATDDWTTIPTTGSVIVESSTGISGYVPVNFEKTQWIQLQLTLNPITSSANTDTFVRLKQVIIR